MKAMVTGAGGFIGGYLVADLLQRGEEVIAVDIKPRAEWWQWHDDAENHADLDVGIVGGGDRSYRDWFRGLLEQCGDVYHLAENMGGIGYIETHRVDCLSSVVPSVHLLNALSPGQHRLFFSSSACAYNTCKQTTYGTADLSYALVETDAWPALPEEGYGLQKLYVEKLCEWHRRERGLAVRVARFHNSYGAYGSWNDGREKAPAALCRKVAYAEIRRERRIEIWGTGEELRSFMYIDDNVRGIREIMGSEYHDPVNLGSAETVSINYLLDIIEDVTGYHRARRTYRPEMPRGVIARTSDNSLLRRVCDGWEPDTTLKEGIEKLYPWIYDRVKATL